MQNRALVLFFRRVQIWLFVLISGVMACASSHQLTVPSTSSVSLRPTGEGWVLDKLNGPNIMFRKQTYKGMYHSVVAFAEFPQIHEIIGNPSGRRRDIGNVVELLQYVKRKISEPESQKERFKKQILKVR